MDQQLEFICVSENQNIMVGASQLVNSPNWTGQLWYFNDEENITSDIPVCKNEDYLTYPLTISVCAGTFLSDTKVLIGNDIGMLAIYAVEEQERLKSPENEKTMSIFNHISRLEHDRSILSVSTTKANEKLVSGSMDCSIKIWDTEQFIPEITYKSAHIDYVTCVRFINALNENGSAGRDTFISTSLDGSCLIWDRRKESPAEILFNEESCRLNCVNWFDESQDLIFLGCDYGYVRAVDIRNPKTSVFTRKFAHGRSINNVNCFKNNSKKYLSVCGDCTTLQVYEYQESLTEVYTNRSHTDFVRDTVWLPDTEALLSCSWDSNIVKHYPFKGIGPDGDN